MAAENAPRAPAPQDDDPAAAATTPVKKLRPAPLVVTTEKTPLVLKAPLAEEVHPLPWFRSPEWAARKSPLAAKRARGGGRRGSAAARADASHGWWCGGAQSAAERDLELGFRYNARRARLATPTDDADGFRQCVQLLVALIVVVAVALLLLVVLQPFREGSEDVAAGGDGGWAALGSG